MNARPTPVVAGEPARVLFLALKDLQFERDDDGMAHYSLKVEAPLGAPLQRALMRVEAELLLQDAASVTTAQGEDGTAEQRRCDAFVALALRVCDALREERRNTGG